MFKLPDVKSQGDSDVVVWAKYSALQSQAENLRNQIMEYEKLRSGAVRILEGQGLQQLSAILVQARIAKGFSQKDLADLLGVREQQIQRYEAENYASASLRRIIQVADALGLKMSEVASLMKMNTLSTARDISIWADHRDAQGKLPKLVRKLIQTTVAFNDIRRIDFRSDEGVAYGGWDGFVETDSGNAFLPVGVSGWELSTHSDIAVKANKDYKNRTENPCGLRMDETTFIFVTPRRWSGKLDWASKKRKEGIWKDVRAYDADDLETWLELTLSVHIWLSEIVGKRIDGAKDLASWWEDFSLATSPPIQRELLVCGRGRNIEDVKNWIKSGPSVLTASSDSPQESIAFLFAALGELNEAEYFSNVARAVVVTSETAWSVILTSDNPLLLVPIFEEVEPGTAVRKGHHVFVPLGRGSGGMRDVLEIGRLTRDETREALKHMGVPDKSLEDMTGLARRNLLSFRRKLGNLQRPAWAKSNNVRDVFPAMLAGRWDERTSGDKDIITLLGDRSYEDTVVKLSRWVNDSDPPARHVGTRWLISSHYDAWDLIRGSVTSDDMVRFEKACSEVFGEVNPAFDLEPDKRWAAATYGVSSKYSSDLRRGLAGSLAIMGAYSDFGAMADGSVGQDHVDEIVRKLMSNANEDETGRLWMSLADVLPFFAEAAPDVVLRAMETDLLREDPILGILFRDDPTVPALFAHSPHPYILWALETLAWAPEYLARATLCLGKLVRNDAGGNRGNRPAGSLRQIFLDWYPQTTASPEKRFEVLDTLRRQLPEVAWDVLISLLPKGMDNAFPSSSPVWRDWRPEKERGITLGERLRYWDETISRLLQDVGSNAKRWDELLRNTTNLPKDLHDKLVNVLENLNPDDLDDRDRGQIRDSLRRIFMKHRRFSSADWAMPEERVNQLEALSERFKPASPIYEYAWLFKKKTDVLDFPGKGFKEQEKELAKRRSNAVTELMRLGGVDSVFEMLGEVENSYELGKSLGRIGVEQNKALESIYGALDCTDQVKHMFSRGFVKGRFESEGWEWVEDIAKAWTDWRPTQRSEFLLSLPQDGLAWDLAEKADSDTESEYWAGFRPCGLSNQDEYVTAAEKLVKHERPHVAVQLLGLYLDHASKKPPVDFVRDTLEMAAKKKPSEKMMGSLFSEGISDLLDYIEKSGAINAPRLASLEWAYLPLLTRGDRPPRLLQAELANNTDFFVEVVSTVYRAEGEKQKDLSKNDETKVKLAHELLMTWHGLPGRTSDGKIDAEALAQWVSDSRKSLAEKGRGPVGDHVIGPILANCPEGEDNIWPHEAVRDVLEQTASNDLDDGFIIGVHNNRGVTTRGPWEGGEQERALAKKYEEYVAALNEKWPRVAGILRRIADSYKRDSRREDQESDLRQDLGE